MEKKKKKVAWWMWLLLAICSYCSLRYLVPVFFPLSDDSARFFSSNLAPMLAIGFLLLAAFALYDDDGLEERDEKPDEPDENTL